MTGRGHRPPPQAAEHTLNTLRYSDRVKELKGGRNRGARLFTLDISPRQFTVDISTHSRVGLCGAAGGRLPAVRLQRSASAPSSTAAGRAAAAIIFMAIF